MKTTADKLILKENEPNFREIIYNACVMFTRLSDGRQRFQFSDNSYIDIYSEQLIHELVD